jgi:integrase
MPKRPVSITVGVLHIHKVGRWWHARHTDDTGRRRSIALRVTNQRAAIDKAKKLSEEIELGSFDVVQSRRQERRRTFAEFTDEFVATHRQWNDRTRKGACGILKALRAAFGSRPLSSITTKDLEDFLVAKKDRDSVADATLNRYLATAKAMFGSAVRRGYLTASPADAIKMLRTQDNSPDALTEMQLEALLTVLQAKGGLAHSVVLTAADTGLRTGELQALTWRDVDLEQGALTVRHSKSYKSRVVPLTRRLREHLAVLYHGRTATEVGGTTVLRVNQDDAPLFPSRTDPTKPFDTIKKGLSAAGHAAGIGHVRPHQLRHTYFSRLRRRGVHAFDMMDLGGWSSLAMVQRYAHSDPEAHRDAVARLEA